MALDTGDLDQITTFPQLLDYLRVHLDWPVQEAQFDDLFFDWKPEEVGLKDVSAYQNVEIRQLRPLSDSQPWGIFFINFPKKDMPVTVLRRLLGALTVRKRKSAQNPEQAVWQKHDLLFISAYGETGKRQLTFAHFQDDDANGDLPRLRVLGWDGDNTVRHLSQVHATLNDKLHWPDNPQDMEQWRARWSSAFVERPYEAITTAKRLASALAELAKGIRARANRLLAVESETGPLRRLHAAFKDALIHDLEPDGFADMYAQTIAYGLLLARISRASGALTADAAALMAPATNPFLQELLQTFLKVGGRKGGMDFDELGVNDIVEMLRRAKMEAVLRDFDDRNPEEDPVIHFYESFLKEYDPDERIQRGVFYTPRPVVSFIVRSVDEVLRRDFGLEDGLADTSTWAEMEKRLPNLKRPEGTKGDEPFVRVLDPATGTGTFLVEVVDLIHKTMVEKWTRAGKLNAEIEKLWNEYVPNHLLPRVYGYELMMAPYAIAHMKLGLKLVDTGYRFGSKERARIFLTNALEEAKDFDMQMTFMSEALAHESRSVNTVKKRTAFTVVIGNPPYSKLSGNLSNDAVRLVEPFRFIDEERIVEKGALAFELALQDDYVKFYGLIAKIATNTGVIVASFITNFGYLTSKYLRGLRWFFLNKADKLAFLNLGGRIADRNTEVTPDENVFDIEQGVAISLIERLAQHRPAAKVSYSRQTGTQKEKLAFLNVRSMRSAALNVFGPRPPVYAYQPLKGVEREELQTWPSLDAIFILNSGAIITSRDKLTVGWDSASLVSTIKRFAESRAGDHSLQEEIGFSVKKKWNVEETKLALREEGVSEMFVKPLYYRPFDIRSIYYFLPLLDTPSRPISEMVYRGDNLVLLSPGVKTTDKFCHVLVSRWPAEKKACSHDRATQMFPLYIRDELHPERPIQNFREDAVRPLAEALAFESGNVIENSRSLLNYIYAILHSPAYRALYGEELKQGFPKVPMTDVPSLARGLTDLGDQLVRNHLFDSSIRTFASPEGVRFAGRGAARVEKGYPQWDNGRVTISGERWFEEVPENVWVFQIGGYQVCEKWLKDRRFDKLDRTLNEDDILHYRRIVVALGETIRLMAEIDRVIDEHGGWPGAFKGMTD